MNGSAYLVFNYRVILMIVEFGHGCAACVHVFLCLRVTRNAGQSGFLLWGDYFNPADVIDDGLLKIF